MSRECKQWTRLSKNKNLLGMSPILDWISKGLPRICSIMLILNRIKLSFNRMKKFREFKLKKWNRFKKIKKFRGIKLFINYHLWKKRHLEIRKVIKIYKYLLNKIDQKVKDLFIRISNNLKCRQALTNKKFKTNMEKISKYHSFQNFSKINSFKIIIKIFRNRIKDNQEITNNTR